MTYDIFLDIAELARRAGFLLPDQARARREPEAPSDPHRAGEGGGGVSLPSHVGTVLPPVGRAVV